MADLRDNVQRVDDTLHGKVEGREGVCPLYGVLYSEVFHLLSQPHPDVVIHVVDEDVDFSVRDPVVVLLLHLAVVEFVDVVSDGCLESPTNSCLGKDECEQLRAVQFFTFGNVDGILFD